MKEQGEEVIGGCLCGAIRYRVGERITGGMICHCRMCQQASGTAFTVNAIYARDGLDITQGKPTWFASSKIADRGFCAQCGSPLFVRYSVAEWRGWIGVSVGSHDHPDQILPERHFGAESQLSWLKMNDDLPHSEYPEDFIDEVAVDDNMAYQTLPRRD
jgi:hypothetical protein